MTVGGEMRGSNVLVDDSIRSLTVGTIADSAVVAGNIGGAVFPDEAADFNPNPGSAILAFSVRGKAAGAFSDTVIAAANLGRVALGPVAANNGGSAFGVAGLTARSVTATPDAGDPIRLSKLDDPAGSVVVGDFVLRLL
jgi:hypothetical protein